MTSSGSPSSSVPTRSCASLSRRTACSQRSRTVWPTAITRKGWPPMAEAAAAAGAPQSASAGKIQVLDLAQLKARIGSKWSRMAEPVQRFFEAAIKRHLGPGDAFHRSAELTYLVIFRGLSQAETELK